MFCPSCRSEFREGFTLCPDCEIGLMEELPEETEEQAEPQDWEMPDEMPEEDVEDVILEADPEKALRSRELLLVLFVGFGPSIFASIRDLQVGWQPNYVQSWFGAGSLLVGALARIALLVYVLSRRGRKLRQLGLTWERADVLPMLLLTAASFLPSTLAVSLRSGPATALNILFPPTTPLLKGLELGPVWWASLLSSAASEELIVRAYMITEVVDLTGDVLLAVLASTCFQALYHLYQGSYATLLSAGTFLIYSIYYVRTRRATPILLAHFVHNLVVYGMWRMH
jgi:membrane protease YdiL (CAAX protease family)